MLKNLLVTFVVVCVLFPQLGVCARYEVAAANYQAEKYELAAKQFMQLAALGNKDAQYAIGAMHVNGRYFEKSPSLGYAWLSLSSSKGVESYVATADKVKASLSEEQLARSQASYQSLLETYGDEVISAKIMPRLSKDSIDSFRRHRPLVKVVANYPKAALNRGLIGNVTVTYLIGKDGRVKYPALDQATSKDFVKTSIAATKAFVYEPARVGGEPAITFGVRNRFTFELVGGSKIKHDRLYNALNDLKEKADKGSSIDRYNYARSASVLRQYVDSERRGEFKNSTHYFSKAAVDGLPQAKYELGKSILYGEQCESDFDSSYFWLQNAAEDGLPEAQMMLGLERLHGVRFEGDKAHAFELLEKASESYDPAKIELAMALVGSTLQSKEQSPDASHYSAIDNLEHAQTLLSLVNERSFVDKISLYEAKALVYASLGDEESKAKMLKKLKKEAKKLKLPFDRLSLNIERQLAGEPVLPLRT